MDRDLIKQQLEYALEGTNFDDQGELYKGKVRDNYINEETITMVTTDRISAFDRVLGTVPSVSYTHLTLPTSDLV